MSDGDVFSRRWVLNEDELLTMLWRCHGGENPDVVLVELYAQRGQSRPRRTYPLWARAPRSSRHIRRENRLER
ncbi:hypothetical protein DFQ14_10750 [Halopolyspora algeriensis]|uniref:Uncharacterized protein n=1 Tax=Halopolyspora algeriensis TaxID=1500506 RepID=A0A368VUM8_9ACTN|nr:hypothetical protein [Halopolyspora algeriensis]RCW43163.1 hypothetical protein DFQ14_10750 [Halopolyspora algeriensis]TQM56221.1 hypothetical protein FHU43_1015 [Halopolyspora algeriensis]